MGEELPNVSYLTQTHYNALPRGASHNGREWFLRAINLIKFPFSPCLFTDTTKLRLDSSRSSTRKQYLD